MIKTLTSYKKARITDTFWATIVKPFILERDKNKCQKCGTNILLEVHSISRKHIDADDLVTLCRVCHVKLHRKAKT